MQKRLLEDEEDNLDDQKEKIDVAVDRVGKQLKKEEKEKVENLVTSYKPRILIANGTGFYITKEYILTNAHVVCSNDISSGDPCVFYDELRVSFQRVDTSDVTVDVNVDLALLRVDPSANENSVAKLRGTNIQLGEKVAVFGYPLSSILSYLGNFTEGVVSGLSEQILKEKIKYNPQAYNRFQYTAATQSGNSGGPVFDDAGNVIGVVVSGLSGQTQNVNFAINFNTIKKFLEEKHVQYDTMTSNSPLTWKDIAKQAQKFTVPVLTFKNQ